MGVRNQGARSRKGKERQTDAETVTGSTGFEEEGKVMIDSKRYGFIAQNTFHCFNLSQVWLQFRLNRAQTPWSPSLPWNLHSALCISWALKYFWYAQKNSCIPLLSRLWNEIEFLPFRSVINHVISSNIPQWVVNQLTYSLYHHQYTKENHG